MNRFASGLIAGGLIGAVGLTWALSDGKTRKRMAKDTKKVANKAGDLMGNMSNMF